jgi:hypothetical protein
MLLWWVYTLWFWMYGEVYQSVGKYDTFLFGNLTSESVAQFNAWRVTINKNAHHHEARGDSSLAGGVCHDWICWSVGMSASEKRCAHWCNDTFFFGCYYQCVLGYYWSTGTPRKKWLFYRSFTWFLYQSDIFAECPWRLNWIDEATSGIFRARRARWWLTRLFFLRRRGNVVSQLGSKGSSCDFFRNSEPWQHFYRFRACLLIAVRTKRTNASEELYNVPPLQET